MIGPLLLEDASTEREVESQVDDHGEEERARRNTW